MNLKSTALRLLPAGVLRLGKTIHYGRVVRRATESDEPDLLVARGILRPGDVAFDVGANIGIYTKFLSRYVGPGGLVVSMEPADLTFAMLTRTVRALKLPNVELMNVAVSDQGGQLVLEVPSYDSGGENYYQTHVTTTAPTPGSRRFDVRCLTLDSLAESWRNRVQFVKCDVEGHELACIRGAASLLRPDGPAWLIELSSSLDVEGADAMEIGRRFATIGFGPFWFDGRSLRRRSVGDRSVNYFFLGQAHLERVKAAGLPVVGG